MVGVLYGNEPYLIDREIHMRKEKYGEMGFHLFHNFCEEAMGLATQASFFSAGRVIAVYADSLEYAPFWEYIKKPAHDTDFLVIAKKMDKRTKAYKALKEMGLLMERNKLDQGEFKKFVLQRLARAGKSIKEEAYGFLASYCGYFDNDEINLYSIQSSLDQICAIREKEVAMDDIMAFFEEGETAKAYEIANSLIRDGGGRLFLTLGKLICQNENAIGMLSLLQRNFRLAYKASLLSGNSIAEISRLVGVPAYQFKDYLKFSPSQVDAVLTHLESGIRMIKEGRGDARLSLITTMAKIKNDLTAGNACEG